MISSIRYLRSENFSFVNSIQLIPGTQRALSRNRQKSPTPREYESRRHMKMSSRSRSNASSRAHSKASSRSGRPHKSTLDAATLICFDRSPRSPKLDLRAAPASPARLAVPTASITPHGSSRRGQSSRFCGSSVSRSASRQTSPTKASGSLI